jgi:hypothetical protein
MIVARQFTAWNRSIKNPSSRARSDPYPRLINRRNRCTPIGPNHTVPYGTIPICARIPGNELHGYHHLVPPVQSPYRVKTARPSHFLKERQELPRTNY